MTNFLKKVLITSVSLCSLIGVIGCQRPSGDSPTGEDPSDIVYLNINLSRANLRAQGDTPSVNKDLQDREDKVSNLYTFLFPYGVNGTIGKHVADTPDKLANIQVAVKPGRYDFYFVANVPDAMKSEMESINDAATLLEKMKELQTFSDWKGIDNSKIGFLMARIYKNQDVPKGGTKTAPQQWTPKLPAQGQQKPVSSYGEDYQQSTTPNSVNLVRSTAKVEINLKGPGADRVKEVNYHNAAKEASFMELSDDAARPQHEAKVSFTGSALTGKQVLVYPPERLFTKTETAPAWIKSGNDWIGQNGAENFVELIMNSGRVYRIPVITATPQEIAGHADGYLGLAREASTKANFNVIRNHHYSFNITIPEDDKDLVVEYKVMPWTLVKSYIDFGVINVETETTTQNISVENHGVEIKPDQPNVILLHSGQATQVRIKFKIEKPIGAVWGFSLSNTLDFSIELYDRGGSTPIDGTMGVIGETPSLVDVVIKPTKKYINGVDRSTELYLLVNGEEVQLCKELSSTETGPGKRYRIVQTS